MTDNCFFDESTEQSRIKAEIVKEYFITWASVMMSSNVERIAYIDLFAGPGVYADGTESTPILVLKKAIKDQKICSRLVCIFNDMDKKNIVSLKTAVSLIPSIENLKYEPVFYNEEVGDSIVKLFEQKTLVPTLFFIDPWGYKGLSLRLINSVLKDWGCDCIFFFNYNRINMALNNDFVKYHMDCLFGETKAHLLREKLHNLSSTERENLIIEEFRKTIKECGPKYVLNFRFLENKGNRTSHLLLFVTKHQKGYTIMKEIFAKKSTSSNQGVATFEYNPTDAKSKQLSLFEPNPLDDLGKMLLSEFSGKTIKMEDIYNTHNVDRLYTIKNYKDILMKLEKEEIIRVSEHRQKTFGKNVMVSFPPFESND